MKLLRNQKASILKPVQLTFAVSLAIALNVVNAADDDLSTDAMIEKLSSGTNSTQTKSLVKSGQSDVAVDRMDVLTQDRSGAKNFVVVERVAEAPRLNLNIEFDYDSSDLRSNSIATLRRLADALKSSRVNQNCQKYAVNGHTDSVGSKDYNYDLSLRRAASVQNYLVGQQNIDVFRLEVYGFGEEAPTSSNDTKENRQRNRRVEIECQ